VLAQPGAPAMTVQVQAVAPPSYPVVPPAPAPPYAQPPYAQQPNAQQPYLATVPAPVEERRWPRVKRLYLDLPAIDVHENLVLGFWPSMRQSLAITNDVYYLLHTGLVSVPYPDIFPELLVSALDYAVIATVDYISPFVPPFLGWQHEEWHRSVMSQYGISSFNDVYNVPLFDELINVSHVTDEDLTRLKRDHPADQVRMSSAGIEGDLARGIAFDKDRFFRGTRTYTLFIEWLGTLNAIFYMQAAAFDSNEPTEEVNVEEGANVERRDFTGLDPDGWVYDLFRPNEPYADRGVHPSGVGIDRYRSESDLSPGELRFLQKQARLSWLNMINPQLIGLYKFEAGEIGGSPFTFNAGVHHVMAPFGYTIGLNLFAKAGRYKAFAELRTFMNDTLVLPGLSVELLRYPLPWRNANLTPRVRLWLQPKDQSYYAESAAFGGSLEARLNVPLLPELELYVEVAGKTVGWIPGNEFLHESLNLRTGLEAFLF
jgi:hypothetical protein